MRISNKNTRKLRLLPPLFCSIAVLVTGQALAGTPSVSLNADAERGNIAESGRVGYVGGSTRVGVSIDKNMQGQVDINQIVAEDDASATSVEGWFGYQIKDKNGAEKGIKGGGVKLNHLWADGDGKYQGDTVHKVFGAYDRDANDHAKVTAGYGQEQRDLFWSGQVSKGVSDKQKSGSGVATKAYDYGIGAEIGTFLEDSLTRIRGALNYEWGTDQADHEDKPTQATISAGVQQYFYDSPHSVTLDVSASKKSGGKSEGETTASNARLGYQYEFGKKGTFQSDSMIKRVRVEVPGTPAVAAIAGRAAIPAVAGRPAQYTKKAIQKPYTKLVKTTMKLENETFFKLNSAKLTTSAKQNLLKIAAEIRRSRYKGSIRITGNTCGLGSAEYDQRLSERRAYRVKKFLVSKGFNTTHLIARGLGKDHPKYRNVPGSGFKNRRVDIEYVTERSTKKKMYKTEYKNVLISAATLGRPGLAGTPGRAGSAETPARFIWKTEEVRTAPVWIKRALHNPIRHKRSVDTYQTSTKAPVTPVDDRYTLTSRDGILDVLGNDGAGLTITQIVAAPAHGTAVIVDGKIHYTAHTDYVGDDRFTYEVKDAYGKTQTAVVYIIVPEGVHNVAPIAINDELTTNVDTAVSQNIITNDSDADGDTLTLANLSEPSFGTVTQNGNIITYTPETGFSGTDTFTYTVFDGKGHEATATVTVIIKAKANSAPKAVNDAFSTDENTSITYDVLGNDTDSDGDHLTISTKTDGTQGTVKIVEGKIEYTPHSDYTGTDTFTYTISDGKGHTDTATVTVTIKEDEEKENTDPEASDDAFTIYVNTEKSYDVLDNDHDDEGDTLTITAKTNGTHGTVEIVDGKIKYVPNLDYIGTDTFTYTISDGKDHTDTATVSVTIKQNEEKENAAPEASDDAFTTYVNTEKSYDVLDNDHDDEGDTLTITAKTNGTHGTVEIVDGKIKYVPESNYIGTDSFTYTISDGEGGSDIATVTVTIEGIPGNTAPEAADDAVITYINTAMTYDVIDNDHDDDGDKLSISATTEASHGRVKIDNDQIKYTPDADYTGTDRFTYTITDSKGHSATATVTVTIKQAEVNKAPEAVDDSFTTYVNTAINYDVIDNDHDADGDTLTISSKTEGAHGTVAIANNKITYTPNRGYTGVDTFTYTLSDGNNHQATATVTATIKAASGNIAPVATDDTVTTEMNAPITSDVLANDTDADGDSLTLSTYTAPTNGSVTRVGNKLVYTPQTSFVGADSFRYSISDSHGHTATATVNITVTDPGKPDLSPNYAATYGDIPVIIRVLADDTDPDGDTLTLVGISTAPAHGTATIIGNEVKYEATTGYVGTDTFRYEATDSNGHTLSAQVTIDVKQSIAQHVGASDDYMRVNANKEAVTLDVTANDSDIQNHPLIATVLVQPSNGTTSVSGGSITFTPGAGYTNSDSFDYKACDTEIPKHCDTATVFISNSAQSNTAPVISTINAFRVNTGTTTSLDLTSFISDAEFDEVYLSAADALSGSLTFTGLIIQYTPQEAASGSIDSIHIEVRDGNGGTANASFTVNID